MDRWWHHLGLGVTSRSVATPGVRDKLDDIEGEAPFDKEASDRHHANTMRAQYLSSDPPEIQVECRDLARKMQHPSNLDEVGVKRFGSFSWSASEAGLVVHEAKACRTHRMLVRYGPCWLYPNQEECFWLMLGSSTVSTNRKGQAVIALSSSEAECYGLVSATSRMLGLQNILLDWGWTFKAHAWMDATAGIAIGSRRGLGRVKHIDTVFLWVQRMVPEDKISLGKKPTKEMQADSSPNTLTLQRC